MRTIIFNIMMFATSGALGATSHCELIEERLTESIASCLAGIDGVVSAAVVDVRAPIAHVDGKVYLTRSEKEAEALKEEIITNLKTLAGQDIKIFASSRVEKNFPRLISVDLIVGPILQPASDAAEPKKKSEYFVQSNIGLLHHDDSRALYRNITLSAHRKMQAFRAGVCLENSSDDTHMDLLSVRLLAERPFALGGARRSIIPGFYVGSLATKSQLAPDAGALISAAYLFSEDISFYLSARRGRFTGSIGAGLEVSL